MRRCAALGVATLAIMVAHAGAGPLVTLTPEGGVLNVPGGSPLPITMIGSGLRKKTILFVTFKVSSARFLVATSDAKKFERTPAAALTSLDQIPAVAMLLTFERSVSAQQMSDSVNAAMNANGYNVNDSPELQRLLSSPPRVRAEILARWHGYSRVADRGGSRDVAVHTHIR